MLCWLCSLLAWAAGISLVTFLVPYAIHAFHFKEQDLKKKYGATWAVVTGASSGIGRALTEKLADQGINVVMVALDDKVFADTFAATIAKYKHLQFRKVGVNLGALNPAEYMEPIVKATEDIQPNLIFNNAGYMATGLFVDLALERQIMNYNCNATSPMYITHHFAQRLVANKQKGAIFFTSSPGGFMPAPSTLMYGATKAFVTNFASALAAELKPDNIDVLVVHPSPVDTAFYSGNSHNLDSHKFFQKSAVSPATVASCFFSGVGRTVVYDQGYYPLLVRIALKVIDINLITFAMSRAAALIPDFSKLRAARDKAK